MIALNAPGPDDLAARFQLLNEIFGRETKAWIEPPFYFCYGTNIELGERCYINFNCNFVDDGKISIGNKVMVGPAVTIATVGHPINPHYRAYMYTDPVRIADNCWIGAGSIICPGGHDRRKQCDRGRQCGDEGYSRQFGGCRQSLPCFAGDQRTRYAVLL